MTNEVTALPDTKDIMPRDYQIEAYHACANAIRHYKGPFYVEASVGAGKTVMMAMILARAQEAGMSCMVLARAGELVEQNAETFWVAGVKNSIYSASCGIKSMHYPVIVGSEGTVARALHGELKDFVPAILGIDENHELNYDDSDTQYMQIVAELLRRNPKLRIFGMSGSPWRGSSEIKGTFWRDCVYRVRTDYLVSRGYLTPTIFGFGHDDTRYDLREWKAPEHDDGSDYTQKELLAMQRKITKDITITQLIMAEVVRLTADRNAVMITGAGRKHLEQMAECLPDDSWVIITQATGNVERRDGLRAIKEGRKKYLLQVGCLTTGYDEPLIDTSVIMRKIRSLKLLVQLLGRGMRLLKPWHIEAGIVKDNHLVLDYTDTMEELGELYADPILEDAQKTIAQQSGDVIDCPRCGTENSRRARRCIGDDLVSKDGRCEFFWSSKTCPKCGTENDQCARECRECQHMLVDPNANLSGKHYTDNDWRDVHRMTMSLTKSGDGIVVEYLLRGEPQEGAKTKTDGGKAYEKATEVYFPSSPHKWAAGAWKSKFLSKHLHRSWWPRVSGKTAPQIIKMAAMFDTPAQITHRINADGKSVIHRKAFLSGRETIAK